MELTAKGRYAVRVMADIARYNEHYVSISDISARQNISVKFLEKIIGMLTKSRLLESMRGANGGYKLTKPASDYTVKEILDATGDKIQVAACIHEKNCPKMDNCDTFGVWSGLNDAITSYLENITLEDLIKNKNKGK